MTHYVLRTIKTDNKKQRHRQSTKTDDTSRSQHTDAKRHVETAQPRQSDTPWRNKNKGLLTQIILFECQGTHIHDSPNRSDCPLSAILHTITMKITHSHALQLQGGMTIPQIRSIQASAIAIRYEHHAWVTLTRVVHLFAVPRARQSTA